MGVQIDKKNSKIYYAVMTKYGDPTVNNGHYRIMHANLDGSNQKVKCQKIVARKIGKITKHKVYYYVQSSNNKLKKKVKKI